MFNIFESVSYYKVTYWEEIDKVDMISQNMKYQLILLQLPPTSYVGQMFLYPWLVIFDIICTVILIHHPILTMNRWWLFWNMDIFSCVLKFWMNKVIYTSSLSSVCLRVIVMNDVKPILLTPAYIFLGNQFDCLIDFLKIIFLYLKQ